MPESGKSALQKALKPTIVWAAVVFAGSFPVTKQFEADPNYRLLVQLVATCVWALLIFLFYWMKYTNEGRVPVEAGRRNEPDAIRGKQGENVPHTYGILAGIICLVNWVAITKVLDIELSSLPIWWIAVSAVPVFFFAIWLIYLPMIISNNRALPNEGVVELLTGLGVLLPLFWLAALIISLTTKQTID